MIQSDEVKEQIWRLADTRLTLPSVSEFSQMSLVSCLRRDLTFLYFSFQDSYDETLAFLACKTFMERSTIIDWDFRLQVISNTSRNRSMNDDQKEFNQTIFDMFKKIFTNELFHRMSECLKALSSSITCEFHHHF